MKYILFLLLTLNTYANEKKDVLVKSVGSGAKINQTDLKSEDIVNLVGILSHLGEGSLELVDIYNAKSKINLSSGTLIEVKKIVVGSKIEKKEVEYFEEIEVPRKSGKRSKKKEMITKKIKKTRFIENAVEGTTDHRNRELILNEGILAMGVVKDYDSELKTDVYLIKADKWIIQPKMSRFVISLIPSLNEFSIVVLDGEIKVSSDKEKFILKDGDWIGSGGRYGDFKKLNIGIKETQSMIKRYRL